MKTFNLRFAALAALPLLGLAAACGSTASAAQKAPASTAADAQQAPGSTGSAARKTPGPKAVAWRETAVKFAGCMRKNGIDIPDPEVGQDIDTGNVSKVSQETLTKAMKACKEWDSVLLGGSEPATPEEDAAFAKYAQCLRDGGVWQPLKDEKKPKDFKEVDAAAAEKVLRGCAHLAPPAPYEQ
ncbi:hypothetical protein [Streptosporangium sp. NPDC000396]|uniref:hypothetical protein n=1 Tax=Streptosporangium sp. NPDC000396 TaxID=3366185 RepID=UPI0036B69760